MCSDGNYRDGAYDWVVRLEAGACLPSEALQTGSGEEAPGARQVCQSCAASSLQAEARVYASPAVATAFDSFHPPEGRRAFSGANFVS